MLFGNSTRTHSGRKLTGLLSGGLRSAALVGAGVLTLRWWRNRQASPRSRSDEPVGRNPVHGWQ